MSDISTSRLENRTVQPTARVSIATPVQPVEAAQTPVKLGDAGERLRVDQAASDMAQPALPIPLKLRPFVPIANPRLVFQGEAPTEADQFWAQMAKHPKNPLLASAAEQMGISVMEGNPGPHHGLICYYAAMFMRGDAAQRQEALGGVLAEMQTGNSSAFALYQDLTRIDAVAALQSAKKGSPEYDRALQRLARLTLEESDSTLKRYLDDLPEAGAIDKARTQAQADKQRNQAQMRKAALAAGKSDSLDSFSQAAQQVAQAGREQLQFGQEPSEHGEVWWTGQQAQVHLGKALAKGDRKGALQMLETMRDLGTSKDLFGADEAQAKLHRAIDVLKGSDPELQGQVMDALGQELSKAPASLAPFLKIEDILGGQGREAVEKAKAEARKFLDENYSKGIQALDAFMDAPDAKTRELGLQKLRESRQQRLENTGRDNFGTAVDWAQAYDTIGRGAQAQDPSAALKTIEELENQANAGSHQAHLYLNQMQRRLNAENFCEGLAKAPDQAENRLKELGLEPDQIERALKLLPSQKGEDRTALLALLESRAPGQGLDALKQSLAQPGTAAAGLSQFQRSLPSNQESLQDYRVRRHLRELNNEASSGQFRAALTGLRAEVKNGNDKAKEWLPWTEAQSLVAGLKDAKDAQQIQETVNKLAAMAADNPVARRALSALVLQDGNSDALHDWMAQGNDEVRVPGQQTKPIFPPKIPRELQQTARTAAASALAEYARQGHPWEASEAQALAIGYGRAAESKDPVAAQLELLLREQLKGAGQAKTLESITQALLAGSAGGQNLADLYLSVPNNPSWKKDLPDFESMAKAGQPSGYRMLAAAVSGFGGTPVDKAAIERSKSILEAQSADPQERKLVLEALLKDYSRQGDGAQLLATIGAVLNQEGDIPPAAIAALKQGLKSPKEADSAVDGYLAFAKRWDKDDLETLTSPVREDFSKKLSSVAPKLDGAQVQELTKKLESRLQTCPSEEKVSVVRALGALGGRLDKQVVERLLQLGQENGQSKEVGAEVGRSLLQVLARHPDEGLKERLSKELLEKSWGDLKTDGKEFKALVDYAAGRPLDVELSEAVLKQIYDAGLPRSPLMVVKSLGALGDSKKLNEMATRISKNYGAEKLRKISERVALYNALPPQVRAACSGSEAAIDPRQVLAQMDQGVLQGFSCRNAFLLTEGEQSLEQVAQRAKSKADVERSQIARDIGNKETQKQRALGYLKDVTKEGVGFFTRICAPEAVDHLTEDQRREVSKIRRLEGEIGQLQARKFVSKNDLYQDVLGPEALLTHLKAADQVSEHASLMNAGKTREADLLALSMYAEHGETLIGFAPGLWSELNQTGERPIDRGSWQRLHKAGLAQFERVPIYPMDPEGLSKVGFEQALGDLAKAERGFPRDSRAVGMNALRALDSEPALAALGKASGVMSQDLQVLGELFQAAKSGTRFEPLVADMRKRAANVSAQIQALQPKIPQLRERLASMEAALKGMAEGPNRNQLAQRIRSVRESLELVSPEGAQFKKLNYILKTVQSREFNASTLGNWMAQEGVDILVVAAGAALGTAAIVLTCGAAAPLVFVAAGAALGAAVTREVGREALYHIRNNGGPDIGVDRSRIAKAFSGDTVLDHSKQEERRYTVLDAYSEIQADLAKDFLFALGGGYVVKLGAGALSQTASSVGNSMAKEPAKQMLFGEMAKAFTKEFGKQYAIKVPIKAGGAVASEVKGEVQGKLFDKQAVDEAKLLIPLAQAAFRAKDSGIELKPIQAPGGPKFQTNADLQRVANHFRLEGHQVEKLPSGGLKVTTYDGVSFEVGGPG